jgi:hypothetical protein
MAVSGSRAWGRVLVGVAGSAVFSCCEGADLDQVVGAKMLCPAQIPSVPSMRVRSQSWPCWTQLIWPSHPVRHLMVRRACQCSSARRALDSLPLHGMTALLTQRSVSCRSTSASPQPRSVVTMRGGVWLASSLALRLVPTAPSLADNLLHRRIEHDFVGVVDDLGLVPNSTDCLSRPWRSGGRPHRAGSPRGRPIEGVSRAPCRVCATICRLRPAVYPGRSPRRPVAHADARQPGPEAAPPPAPPSKTSRLPPR